DRFVECTPSAVPLKGEKKRASAPEVRVSQTAEQLEPAASSQKRPSPLHLLRDLRHSSVETQSIVVLDFGAQYSQLIARRIREQNVFSVVLPCTASLGEIRSYSPVGIILSGGPCSVYDADAPPADPRVLQLDVPVLGICYGLQFMVHVRGGKVRAADKREYGHADVEIQDSSSLFHGLPRK